MNKLQDEDVKTTVNVYSNSEAAHRYDPARSLPAQTISLWMELLKSCIPKQPVRQILDLGCGTGHFTSALRDAFECRVIGMDPSIAMLDVASSKSVLGIDWIHGRAESIPINSASVDIVFMSQVFHHLGWPVKVLLEIKRVLTSAGYLVIRNGTSEHNHEIEWLKFFPEALEIEEERMPSAEELKALVCGHSFMEVSQQTVTQLSAYSYQEFFVRVSHRGLSSLMIISDEAFARGLRRFQQWVSVQPHDRPVYEPLELLIARNTTAP